MCVSVRHTQRATGGSSVRWQDGEPLHNHVQQEQARWGPAPQVQCREANQAQAQYLYAKDWALEERVASEISTLPNPTSPTLPLHKGVYEVWKQFCLAVVLSILNKCLLYFRSV